VQEGAVLREYGRWVWMAADFGNFKPILAKPHYHLMVRGIVNLTSDKQNPQL
jgi:hypothetical protein